MDIRISKELYEACEKDLKKAPFNQEGSRYTWYDYSNFSLGRYTEAQLLKLVGIFGEHEALRGTKTIIRDINNWIAANKTTGKKLPRARSTSQAVDYMKVFLARYPRHHLYRQRYDAEEGVTVAYYVYGIDYHPPRDHSPAYLILKTVRTVFGVNDTKHFSAEACRCVGRTSAEILVDLGLMVETEALREDYEHYLARYNALKDQIGKQMLATGIGSTEKIDGNKEEESRWYYRDSSIHRLEKGGEPARVLIDVFRESDNTREARDDHFDRFFWSGYTRNNITYKESSGEPEWTGDDEDEDGVVDTSIEVPVHPYLPIFDLSRHKRMSVHVGFLTEYEYTPGLRHSLILPSHITRLIDTLMVENQTSFRDVIKGKSGGTIILAEGMPGTGKTMTAEVYCEAMERPLYTIQCSQLGTDPDDLEEELLKVLARAKRWGAILLLDEADVYIHKRGDDLIQNAIVGVFLRVLEYHNGVMFMTTNRAELVDDAILSRCVCRLPYKAPSATDQFKIWQILAKANGIELDRAQAEDIVASHPGLSGRDVKNLLKLANMVSKADDRPIDAELIEYVLQFKPTMSEVK